MSYKLRALINKLTPSFILPMIKKMWYKSYGTVLFKKGMSKGKKEWTNNLSSVTKNTKEPNDLERFFNEREEGPGIWKWRHYFDVYDKHLRRFRNRPVRILEIGIYSGGSLDMWMDYFDGNCVIYGIDIEDSCKVYENDKIKVFIGDQADRSFWQKFTKEVGPVDIVIDDGGHLPLQQLVTLEEILGHINPGGVFLCEDITGIHNPFHAYMDGLSRNLHEYNWSSNRKEGVIPTSFQRLVHSIHSYPFVTVIETQKAPIDNLVAPRHGTQWQPFFGKVNKADKSFIRD